MLITNPRILPANGQTITATAATLKAEIARLKRECRPAGRGRPSYWGWRAFEINGHTVTVTISESCIGAGGWGITVNLLLDGKRTSLAKALANLSI